MKLRNVYKLFILLAFAVIWQGRSAGPGNVANLEVSGAPGSTGNQGTCANTGCHTSGSFNPSLTLQLLDATTSDPIDEYVPGQVYQATLTFAADAGAMEYGMQAVILDETDANIGAWDAGSLPSGIQITELGGRSYIEHSQPSTSEVWTANWTAPEAGSGDITLYAAGIASNNNGGTSGDGVASASLTIPEAAANSVSEIDRSFASITVNPNPVRDWAKVLVNSRVSGNFQLNVVSITGQTILSERFNLLPGQNDRELNLSNLDSGVYLMQLVGKDQTSTKQFIKL